MFRTEFNPDTIQWIGQPIESDFEINQSLGKVILDSLKAYGQKVAQICANTGKTKTFDELHTLTLNTAKWLQLFGCEKGDLIYFFTKNTEIVPVVIFAALYLGLQVAASPVYFSRMECECFLKLLKPKLVFCDVDIYQKLKQCLEYLNNGAKIFTFDGVTNESTPVNVLFESPDVDTHLEPVKVDAFTHTAFIVETSGTTGKVKFVRISHAAILDKMTRLKYIFQPSDIVLGFTRLYGVSGIRSLIGSTLNGSTRIVNHDPFSPKRYLELVEKFNVTVSIGFSTLAADLLDHAKIEFADLGSLKFFCIGGTKIPFDVIQKMSKHLPVGKVCQTYGMTETAGTIAMNMSEAKNDCVGQLISGCIAKIINDAGERLGIGKIGELCLKFPFSILGYFEDDCQSDMDSEGFFMTGDLARFDENNDLFIVDRKKEVFKCYGNSVSPTEIEEYLNTIYGVKQSCVVPIPDPNQNFNCLPAALIVKTTKSKCTEKSIHQWVSINLCYYKQLRGGVYFVDELPLNISGKIDRKLVKRMAIEFFTKSSFCKLK